MGVVTIGEQCELTDYEDIFNLNTKDKLGKSGLLNFEALNLLSIFQYLNSCYSQFYH